MEPEQLHDDEGRCHAQSMRLNSSLFHWMRSVHFQPQRLPRSSMNVPAALLCHLNVAAQRLLLGPGDFGWNEVLESGMIPTSACQQTWASNLDGKQFSPTTLELPYEAYCGLFMLPDLEVRMNNKSLTGCRFHLKYGW